MESNGTWPTWEPDVYDISKPPSMESTLHLDLELGTPKDFPRQAKWCSDGSSILSQSENGNLHLFEVTWTEESKTQFPLRQFQQPSPILDFIWYPTASSCDPASFCFVTSVRECPVKLLDASDGRLRASYKIVDHRERQVAPHSLTFDLTAQKLYCGFEDAIEVFDVSRPGEGTRIPTTPSKKSKDGLKGIISSLAFSPSFSPDECFYAAGSFMPTAENVAMFSDAQPEPLMYLGGGPQAGVTQLKFNPTKPHILYAGYRGHANGLIYSWDIRSNVDAPLEIFQAVHPSSETRTNQKMRFDIDVAGRLLSLGDQRGNISIFELNTSTAEQDLEGGPSGNLGDTKITLPTLQFKAHEDAVGSVAFHPFESRLLSTSGSRHFVDVDEELESSDESDVSGEFRPSASVVRGVGRKSVGRPVTYDSTMKFWDLRRSK